MVTNRRNRHRRSSRWVWLGSWLTGLVLFAGCDRWDLPRLPARQIVTVDTTSVTNPTTTTTTTPRPPQLDLTKGLIAYYPFNGTTLDSSGNNLNGVLVNGANYGPDRHATTQSALLLDGINDYFEVFDTGKLRPDSVSISVWIKARVVSSTSHLYNKSNWTDNQNQQYSAFIKPPNPLPATDPCCAIWADVNQDGTCTVEQPIQQPINYYDPAFEMNRWYHLVTVFAGKTGKLYLNGVLKQTETTLPANPVDKCAGGNLRFGAQYAGDVNYFNGSMDDIRIYNRSLTDAEVNALYKR